MGDINSPAWKLPLLAPAEWRIFFLLCKHGPLTVRQIVDLLSQDAAGDPPSYTTILTLAKRLADKGYASEMPGKSSLGRNSAITYTPSAPYAESLRIHLDRFLSQFCLGDPESLRLIRERIDWMLDKTLKSLPR